MNKLFFFASFSNKILTYFVFFAISYALEKHAHFEILFVAILAAAGLTYILNMFQVILTNRKISFLKDLLLNQFQSYRLSKDIDAKNLYNKINAIIDNPFCKVELASHLSSIAFIFLIYFYIFKYQALIIFLIAIATIPIIYFLKVLTEKFFIRVTQLTERRNSLISNMIKFRFSLLSNVEILKKTMSQFHNIITYEKKWRLIDSSFKTLETYLSLLYKYIPYLLATLTFSFVSSGTTVDPKLYWLSIPVFATLLALPRQFLSNQEYENGINYLKANQEILLNSNSTIVFNDQDVLWKTSLINNIIYADEYIISIFKELNLWKELNLSQSSEPLKIIIDADKLSEGQKQRLLFIRAICLAKYSNKPLIIKSKFRKLDKVNQLKVYNILKKIDQDKFIELEYELNIFHSDTVKEYHIDPLPTQDLANSQNGKKISQTRCFKANHIIIITLTFLLFFAVAAIDCYVASLINSTSQTNNSIKFIFSLSVFSFILAIYTGAFFENFIRKICFKNIQNSLNSPFVEKEHIEKAISIDFTICLEDFSFYTHDFLWISSLFVLSLLSMVLFLGTSGLYLSFSLILFITIIYLNGYKRIIQYRNNFIHQAKFFVEACNNMILADRCWSHILRKPIHNKVKKELIFHNMLSWTEAKYNLNNSKIFLSSNLQFISSLAIAATIYIFGNMNQDAAIVSGVLTALLAVQNESLRFFVSLSGVISTKNSASFILNLNNISEIKPLQIKYSNDILNVASYQSAKTNIKYTEFNYSVGLNIVSGVSGSGKTTYFLDVYKSAFMNNISCLYITYDFFNDQMKNIGSFENTVDYFFKKPREPKLPNIVIFDEVTNIISDNDLDKVIKSLYSLAIQAQIILILSDHRISHYNNSRVYKISNDKT